MAALTKLVPLSSREVDALTALLTLKRFERGAFLLEAGQRVELCFFITSGLVREFYIDAEGDQATRRFLSEGELTGSLLDLLTARPAVTFIEALEPVDALVWKFAEFDALTREFPAFQLLARRIAEDLYVRKAKREHEMLAMSAAQRHANWVADHASLDARVSRKDLASDLGITPEHLSRLRSATR
jgi:CRP-like cAMP-binding protein